jgi:hypothetical protein
VDYEGREERSRNPPAAVRRPTVKAAAAAFTATFSITIFLAKVSRLRTGKSGIYDEGPFD